LQPPLRPRLITTTAASRANIKTAIDVAFATPPYILPASVPCTIVHSGHPVNPASAFASVIHAANLIFSLFSQVASWSLKLKLDLLPDLGVSASKKIFSLDIL